MAKWHGGKGSAVRKGADQKKFESNWDAIFGNKERSEKRELHGTSGEACSTTSGNGGDNGNDTK